MSKLRSIGALAAAAVVAPAITTELYCLGDAHVLSDLLVALPFGIVFGFVGSAIFLAAALLLAAWLRSGRIGLVVAGALAGALHTLVSWVLVMSVLNGSVVPGWAPVVLGSLLVAMAAQTGKVVILGGFACLAGALSGLVYAVLTRPRGDIPARSDLRAHLLN